MRRDDDLLRAIMLEIERAPVGARPDTEDIAVTLGRDPTEVFEHGRLLLDAGWIVANDASSFSSRSLDIVRLTMAGHDFLAAVRSETIWKKALARAAPLGAVPLEVLKALAIDAVKDALGLGRGG